MRQKRQREVVRLEVAAGPEQSSFLDGNYKPWKGRCPGGQGSPGPSDPGRLSVIRHGGPLGRDRACGCVVGTSGLEEA